LNVIQPIRLFARLIRDSQPFWANTRCCPNPNSYERDTIRFNLNQKKIVTTIRFNLNQKKLWLYQSLNPEPAAYNSSALTATLQKAVAKLQESVMLMQRAW